MMYLSSVFAGFLSELAALLPGEDFCLSGRDQETPPEALAAVEELERRYGPLDPADLFTLCTLRSGSTSNHDDVVLREQARVRVDARYNVAPQGLYREFREAIAYPEHRPATLADVCGVLAGVSDSVAATMPRDRSTLAALALGIREQCDKHYPCPNICKETDTRLVYWTPTVRVQIDALPDGGWAVRLDLSGGMRPSSSLRAAAILRGHDACVGYWQLVDAL